MATASPRILVVDDEQPVQQLLDRTLRSEGYDVVPALDGEQALDEISRQSFDLVMLDVMLPKLDGWRVAEALLEDPTTGEIPIVFLTARAELRDQARGLELGGIDYITKPFNPVELADVIRELLDRVSRGEHTSLRKMTNGV